MKVALPDIRHSLAGYEALVAFYAQTKDCIFDEIQIDMSRVSWFDADMCAAFGAILYRLGDNVNTILLAKFPLTWREYCQKKEALSNSN